MSSIGTKIVLVASNNANVFQNHHLNRVSKKTAGTGNSEHHSEVASRTTGNVFMSMDKHPLNLDVNDIIIKGGVSKFSKPIATPSLHKGVSEWHNVQQQITSTADPKQNQGNTAAGSNRRFNIDLRNLSRSVIVDINPADTNS